MKVLALALMLPALLACLVQQPASASPPRTLKACGHPFYPPVSWHVDDELTGMAPAVTLQLFAELGYRVELIADTNWKRCLQEVHDGNADIVVAAFRTDERARWLHFTQEPIITDAITLFVRRQPESTAPPSATYKASETPQRPARPASVGGSTKPTHPERETVKGPTKPTHPEPAAVEGPTKSAHPERAAIEGPHSLSPLKNRTVGLLLGDSFGDRFDRYVQSHSHIEHVSQGRQNFAKLALGRIELMPLGRLSGHLQSIKLGYASQIRALPSNIATEYYYLALGQHSGLQHHLPWLNQRLAQMQLDGTLGRLVRQYSLQYLNQP